MAGIFGAAINAFAPNKLDHVDVSAVTTLLNSDHEEETVKKSSSSDDDTLSTIHSDDSGPYKEAKRKQLEKRKKN